jgi:hypothetical protein
MPVLLKFHSFARREDSAWWSAFGAAQELPIDDCFVRSQTAKIPFQPRPQPGADIFAF